MITLTMQTILYVGVIAYLISLAVLYQLWRTYCTKYQGLSLWVLAWAFLFLSFSLMCLRGSIPDWISIIVANSLFVSGTLLLYFGLRLFFGKEASPLSIYLASAFFAIFASIHTYFTIVNNSLLIRSYNVNIALVIIYFAILYLLRLRVDSKTRRLSMDTAIAFLIVIVVQLARIFGFAFGLLTTNDFLKSGLYDAALLGFAQGVMLYIVFKLVLMVNQRLQQETEDLHVVIRTSEEKYRSLVENTSDFIWEMDTNGVYTYCSPQIEKLWGLKSDEMLGKTPFDLLPTKEDKEQAKKRFLTMMTSASPFTDMEIRSLDGFGNVRELEISGVPFFNTIGELDGYRGITRDITERKRAESSLKVSELNFRNSLDDSPLGIRILNDDGETVYINRTLLDIYGYDDLEEFNNTPNEKKYTPQSFLEHRNRVEKRHRGEYVPPTYEISIIRKDGEIRYLMVFRKEVVWNGKIQYQAVYLDITERKHLEFILDEERRKLKAAETLGKIGNWEYDVDSQKIIWSDGTFSLYERDPTLGPPSLDEEANYYTAAQATILRDHAERAITTKEEIKHDLELILPSGRKGFFATSMQPIMDKDGKVIKLFGTVQDITERKKAEEQLHQAELRYSTLFQRSNDSIIVIQDGVVILANQATSKITGFTIPEIIGKPYLNFVAPECRDEVAERHRKRIAGKDAQAIFETGILNKDGRTISVETSAARIEFDGKPAVVAIRRDITDRRKAEESLRIAEQNFRNSVENSPFGIHIADYNGAIIHTNKAMLDILGYDSPDELKAIDQSKLYTPKSYTELQERKEKRASEEWPLPHYYETDIVRKDGELRHILASAVEVTWDREKRLQIIYQDITKRKKAEEALRTSEARYRNLIDNAPVGIVINDSTWQRVEVNDTLWKMHGYDSKEDFMKAPSSEFYYDVRDRDRYRAFIAEHGNVSNFVIRNKRKDGSLFWASSSCIRQISQSVEAQYITVVQDITQQKEAEEELKESEERYRALVKLGSEVGEAVVMLQNTEKEESVHLFASETWAKMTGYSQEELANMSFRQLVHPRDTEAARDRYFKRLRGEMTHSLSELSIIRKNGAEIPVEIVSTLTIYRGKSVQVLYIRDITQRKKMEEQLIVQDRLASIGTLVSGVAHELNNPLTSVIGFSDLILEKKIPDDIRTNLQIVNSEAKRTASIVKNLLTFARKQPQEKTSVDVNEVILMVLDLRSYEQKLINTQVMTHLAPDLPKIIGNSSQLQQVFINIIINAEFFMLEAHNKGILTITTERRDNFVRASFTDDGPGIPAESMKNLFTPFFTTKEVGKGTGLGLSICHGIITEHNGKIWAESDSGHGATFIIELPISETLTREGSK